MLLALIYAVADVQNGQPPDDVWQWFYTNVSVQGLLNTAGLGLLAVLFARDLILTKAQHERRVADIQKANDLRIGDMEKAHIAELKAKDDRYEDMLREKTDRYSEMKDSRDDYREAASEYHTRNVALTEGVIESNKAMSVTARALQSLDAVVKERNG